MTSKKLSYGKHALTLRVDPELYKQLRMCAAEMNLSVQELIVSVCELFVQSESRKE